MDVGLVGAGILSGLLGAHIVTMLRERLSLGTWIDSLLGVVGGAVAAQLAAAASAAWAEATVGFVVGRIAAAISAGILGGAALLLFVGLFRPPGLRDGASDGPAPAFRERRSASADRRKGERRVREQDS